MNIYCKKIMLIAEDFEKAHFIPLNPLSIFIKKYDLIYFSLSQFSINISVGTRNLYHLNGFSCQIRNQYKKV